MILMDHSFKKLISTQTNFPQHKFLNNSAYNWSGDPTAN